MAVSTHTSLNKVLGGVCDSLGDFHLLQGEHDKAIEEREQARAIAVELGNRSRKNKKQKTEGKAASCGG